MWKDEAEASSAHPVPPPVAPHTRVLLRSSKSPSTRVDGGGFRRRHSVGRHVARMSSKSKGPDLKKFMDKRLVLKLNACRMVVGVLRGYDQFMNVVLEEAAEETAAGERIPMGTTVRRSLWARGGRGASRCDRRGHGAGWPERERGTRGRADGAFLGLRGGPLARSFARAPRDVPAPRRCARASQVIRGNSIIQMEVLERLE